MGATRFGQIIRGLRVSRGLRQRNVAEAVELSPSTIGNAESAPHRVLGRDAAVRLASFFKLNEADVASLLAAWEETPLSEYSIKQQEYWKKRNELRSKAKNHDPLKLALVELLGLHLMALPDAEICACDFGTVCGVCAALERVGLPPFTPADRDKILTQLVKIRERLAPVTPSA